MRWKSATVSQKPASQSLGRYARMVRKVMDPEQAKYRDLFEALEKEAAEAKTVKRSGKVTNRVVGAGCAAVIAVYTAGYTRTQSAADRFTKQLALRRVAALPLPGVNVVLDRKDVSHPRVENFTMPTGKPPAPDLEAKHEPARVKSPVGAGFARTEPGPSTESLSESTALRAVAPAAAPPDAAPPAPAAPVFRYASRHRTPGRHASQGKAGRSRSCRKSRRESGRTEPIPAGAIPATATSKLQVVIENGRVASRHHLASAAPATPAPSLIACRRRSQRSRVQRSITSPGPPKAPTPFTAQ